MRILEQYSHLNGLEYLWVHKKSIWKEIRSVIESVDAKSCRANESTGNESHNALYSPSRVDKTLRAKFAAHEWSQESNFVKDRITVEMQFEKRPSVAPGSFAKALAFYMSNHVDVGIEILPMRELQTKMSPSVTYYENTLHNLMRKGRNIPRVPLVLLRVAS